MHLIGIVKIFNLILLSLLLIQGLSYGEEKLERSLSSYNKDELKILLEAYLGGENSNLSREHSDQKKSDLDKENINPESFLTSLREYKYKKLEEKQKAEEDETMEISKFNRHIQEAMQKVLSYEPVEHKETLNYKKKLDSNLTPRERLLRSIKKD